MATDYTSLIAKVNQILLDGEPSNISIDEHSGYTGYKPQAVIDAMNEVFTVCGWGFDEVSSEIVTTGDKGSQLAVSQVKARLTGVEWTPPAWGQSRVTRSDIGDAKKGAQTDALKKALSYFSIGNRAYHGLLGKEPEADETTMSKIRAFCKSLGRQEPPETLTQKQADSYLKTLQRDYVDKQAAKGAA